MYRLSCNILDADWRAGRMAPTGLVFLLLTPFNSLSPISEVSAHLCFEPVVTSAHAAAFTSDRPAWSASMSSGLTCSSSCILWLGRKGSDLLHRHRNYFVTPTRLCWCAERHAGSHRAPHILCRFGQAGLVLQMIVPLRANHHMFLP